MRVFNKIGKIIIFALIIPVFVLFLNLFFSISLTVYLNTYNYIPYYIIFDFLLFSFFIFKTKNKVSTIKIIYIIFLLLISLAGIYPSKTFLNHGSVNVEVPVLYK